VHRAVRAVGIGWRVDEACTPILINHAAWARRQGDPRAERAPDDGSPVHGEGAQVTGGAGGVAGGGGVDPSSRDPPTSRG
jgi:hypothetical protein